MSTTPRRLALPLLLLPGLVLAGCGVSDEQPQPGLAADVDGTTLAQSDVDDLVQPTCDYLDEVQGGGVAIPRATVRRRLLEVSVRRIAAEKVLDELGLPTPEGYDAQVAQIEQTYADAPDDQAKAMATGDEDSQFAALAASDIGQELLDQEPGDEDVAPEQVNERGVQAIDDWLAGHDIEVNPTFGARFEGSTLVADDGLSVPASDGATFSQDVLDIDLSAEDQQDLIDDLTAAVERLPADEVCGAV